MRFLSTYFLAFSGISYPSNRFIFPIDINFLLLVKISSIFLTMQVCFYKLFCLYGSNSLHFTLILETFSLVRLRTFFPSSTLKLFITVFWFDLVFSKKPAVPAGNASAARHLHFP